MVKVKLNAVVKQVKYKIDGVLVLFHTAGR